MAQSNSSGSKERLTLTVAEHLLSNGSADWSAVRAAFPEVSDSTFWRVVRSQKKEHGLGAGDAKAKAVKVAKAVKKAREELPAEMVVPAYVRSRNTTPEKAAATVDYLAQINEALSVADLLRDYSKNDKGGVKIPAFLRDSARLRLDSIKAGVAAAAFLADVRRMEEFYQAVVEEIGKESPEMQLRVLKRLHEIGQKHGIGAVGGYQ